MLAARTVTSGLSCGSPCSPMGHPVTVASSDKRAMQVDEVQYEVDDGPCLRSMHTGKQIYITDTTARSAGVGSAHGPPRTVSGRVCRCR